MNRRRAGAVALALLIVAGAIYGLVHALAGSWHDVRDALRRANWWLLGTALALAALSVVGLAHRWYATMRALGADIPRLRSYRWFMTGQLGKYAPGGVWHIVGQGELAARGGVARAVAYSSVILSTITLVAGAAVTVGMGALLPGVGDITWWAVLAGTGAVVVLFEPHLRVLLLRKVRIDPHAVGPATLARLVLGCVPVWLIIGTASWCTVRAFGEGSGVLHTVVGAIGSWLVGIVTLPAPGGIGVREAVFAHALSPTTGSATAALIALVARIEFLVADLACFALARAALRRTR